MYTKPQVAKLIETRNFILWNFYDQTINLIDLPENLYLQYSDNIGPSKCQPFKLCSYTRVRKHTLIMIKYCVIYFLPTAVLILMKSGTVNRPPLQLSRKEHTLSWWLQRPQPKLQYIRMLTRCANYQVSNFSSVITRKTWLSVCYDHKFYS